MSDDRTNVLIVENFPRWEFRYLRNLLYGRDRSVHLQYVMLNPDRIDGTPAPPKVYASASRKFGDAEATALPKSREEWLKFDVIVLGDLPPDVLDGPVMEDIRHCVAERGALLIVIGGPRYMPYAYSNKTFKELLPIQYESTLRTNVASEEGFTVALTPDGREHPAMMLSSSVSESAQVWKSLPPLYWRLPVGGVKAGATILAYAEPVDKAGRAVPEFDLSAAPEEAARRLADQMTRRTQNALIVVHKYALGRVMMLTFDQTWRLRYRVGDTYHHRFWGQVLRWGAGENLRSGTEFVRLGTDQLTYTPDQPVKVLAKIMNQDRQPVLDDQIVVSIFEGERLVNRKPLEYRKDSNGMYESLIGQFAVPRGALTGMCSEWFIGLPTKSPVEMAELTVDRGIPGAIATLSGGAVAGPLDAADLLSLFGPGKQTLRERKETTLWDSWVLLVAMVAVVTTEWILRKRGGLT